ncbi:MAG: neutral/alkaline non-lysosomal ceramidase N-terminal domain-containing protein [Clostridia bacterium]|nr:neutral/alkaline non-lysosomal ceramidase N-terminal domain-containing protein [Clostridia bacterium]
MKNELLLGAARRIITPSVGTPLAGYQPDWFSTSVNDDLSATVFYFEQDGKRALLVSFTLLSIATSISNDLRASIEEKFGIPRESVILHTIHNHSGPNTNISYGWGDANREYIDTVLVPRLMEAIPEAIENRRRVTMAVTVGESRVGINRRERAVDNTVRLGQNPWGSFDPQMTVIAFADEDNKPVANLVHYACHGTAAGKNHEITRDWAGVMIDTLEKETGAITAFLNGPEGDIGPRLTNGKTVGLAEVGYAMRLGAVAGQDAVKIYNQPKYRTVPKLSVTTGSTMVPLAPRIPLEKAKEIYEQFRGETINIRGRSERHYRAVIESYSNGYEEVEGYPIEQTILRLGDVAIVSCPYELFSEIGLRVKKDSPVPYTLILSNTNGQESYYATESELCRGGYEIDMFITKYIQPPVPNADWHYITQTLANLKKTED